MIPYNGLKRISSYVKQINDKKLLTPIQAVRKTGRSAQLITNAMRLNQIDFFFIRTFNKDYFFIEDNDKLEALKRTVVIDEQNTKVRFSYKQFYKFLKQ